MNEENELGLLVAKKVATKKQYILLPSIAFLKNIEDNKILKKFKVKNYYKYISMSLDYDVDFEVLIDSIKSIIINRIKILEDSHIKAYERNMYEMVYSEDSKHFFRIPIINATNNEDKIRTIYDFLDERGVVLSKEYH